MGQRHPGVRVAGFDTTFRRVVYMNFLPNETTDTDASVRLSRPMQAPGWYVRPTTTLSTWCPTSCPSLTLVDFGPSCPNLPKTQCFLLFLLIFHRNGRLLFSNGRAAQSETSLKTREKQGLVLLWVSAHPQTRGRARICTKAGNPRLGGDCLVPDGKRRLSSVAGFSLGEHAIDLLPLYWVP